MKKVVINRCYGGFGLSEQLAIELFKRKNNIEEVFVYAIKEYDGEEYNLISNIEFKDNGRIKEEDCLSLYVCTKNLGKITTEKELYSHGAEYLLSLQQNADREDKDLIELIEYLGEKKSSHIYSELEIIEIPDDVQYEIYYNDGLEEIHEIHRIWY